MGNKNSSTKKYQELQEIIVADDEVTVKEKNCLPSYELNEIALLKEKLEKLQQHLKEVELDSVKTKYDVFKRSTENFQCLLQKMDKIEFKIDQQKNDKIENNINKVRTINNPGDFENHPICHSYDEPQKNNTFETRFRTYKTKEQRKEDSKKRGTFDESEFAHT